MEIKYPFTFQEPSITTVIDRPDKTKSLTKARMYGKHIKKEILCSIQIT